MAEVTWSDEAWKAPAWQKIAVAAAALSTLEENPLTFESVARVESIAYDAEAQRVSTDVRIMPVLHNVEISLELADAEAR